MKLPGYQHFSSRETLVAALDLCIDIHSAVQGRSSQMHWHLDEQSLRERAAQARHLADVMRDVSVRA